SATILVSRQGALPLGGFGDENDFGTLWRPLHGIRRLSAISPRGIIPSGPGPFPAFDGRHHPRRPLAVLQRSPDPAGGRHLASGRLRPLYPVPGLWLSSAAAVGRLQPKAGL